MIRYRGRACLVLSLLVLTCSACGPGDPAGDSRAPGASGTVPPTGTGSSTAPAGTPPAGATPRAGTTPPAGGTGAKGTAGANGPEASGGLASGGLTRWGPVTLALPADFTPVQAPSQDGVQRFGARSGGATSAAGPDVVAVIVRASPARPARAEVEANATIARSTGATSVTTRQVTLPGADDAWALDYDEAGGNGVLLHRGTVAADVGGTLVLIETRGVAAGYQTGALPDILASARFGS